MRQYLKPFAIAVMIACSMPPAAEMARAAQTAEQAAAAKHRINLAGRQRMLSQRVARQICAAEAGIAPDANRAAALQTVETFETVLAGLRSGGAEGLQAEPDPAAQELLRNADQVWQPYATAIRQMAAGATGARLSEVRTRNTAVLTAMNKAVQAMEQAAGGDGLTPELARAINVAGRQRMLIERSLMWTCLQTHGDDPAGDAAQIAAASGLFAASLGDLRAGNDAAGLAPPPSWEVEAQLELVAGLWAGMAPELNAAAAGAPVDQTALALMISRGEALVDALDDAVWVYQNF